MQDKKLIMQKNEDEYDANEWDTKKMEIHAQLLIAFHLMRIADALEQKKSGS